MRILTAATLIGLGCLPAFAQATGQVTGQRATVASMNTYSTQAKLMASFKAGGCKPADAGTFACDITVKSSTLNQPYSFSAIYRKKNGPATQFSLPVADGDQVAGAALGTTVATSIITGDIVDSAQVSAFLAQQMQAAIAQHHPQMQELKGVRFTISQAGDSGFQIIVEKASK